MLFLVVYLDVVIQQKYLSMYLGKVAASNVLMNHGYVFYRQVKHSHLGFVLVTCHAALLVLDTAQADILL